MSIRTIQVAAIAAALLIAGVAVADEPATTPPSTDGTGAATTATAPAKADTNDDDEALSSQLPSRLEVHGYLSQAYARADQHQIAGIPTSGTADYREAALQFRYAMTKSDTFVLQIAHERIGDSPIGEAEVDLDWGFYERRFGPNSRLRVGRVQIPMGIYNEIRDVGTLLPFYRLSLSYYGQGSYTNETVDGAVVMHRFAPSSPWSLEASGYYGGWELTEVAYTITKTKVRDAFGTQLWLSTPVDGLRIGVGGLRATAEKTVLAGGRDQVRKSVYASIDGNFERWMARAEARRAELGNIEEVAYYAELGYRVHPKLMLVAHFDNENIKFPALLFGPEAFDTVMARDFAASVNYFIRPDLVLKLEGHRNRNAQIEDGQADLNNIPRADYAIVSLSVSF